MPGVEHHRVQLFDEMVQRPEPTGAMPVGHVGVHPMKGKIADKRCRRSATPHHETGVGVAFSGADRVYLDLQATGWYAAAAGRSVVRNTVALRPLIAINRLPLCPFGLGGPRDRVGHLGGGVDRDVVTDYERQTVEVVGMGVRYERREQRLA